MLGREVLPSRADARAGTDLTGRDRPIDGDGDGNALCDLGAVEYINTSIGIFSDGFEAD